MGYEYLKQWRARQPNIKEIRAAEAQKWRAAHPDLAKEIKQRYLDKSKDERLPKEAQRARERRKRDPEGDLRRRRAFEDRKRAEQIRLAGRSKPGTCEVCGELNIRIVFDHCHLRGHFRGWICDRCNRVLGLVKDSPSLLNNLARYLIHGETQSINPEIFAIERICPSVSKEVSN